MSSVRVMPVIVVAGLFSLGGCAQAQGPLDCFLSGATAEQAAQRPSPLGVTNFTLGGVEARMCYGRPSARGRVVMGELVPFGQPWRMGANEATALHLPFAARIGEVDVDPGSYSLYAVPGEEAWLIVVNGDARRWGIPINAGVRASDMGSFRTPVLPMDDFVETLTYRWEPDGEEGGTIFLEWENTRVAIPVHRSGTETPGTPGAGTEGSGAQDTAG